MIITEKEASTKRCQESFPAALLQTQAGSMIPFSSGASSVFAVHTAPTHCIGSACMAFRWVEDFTIVLGNGMIVILNKEDADLTQGSWWDGRYVKTADGYLHIRIMERVCGPTPTGMLVDHWDGDTLNYRRGNLRLATPAENAANAAPRGGKSKYRGVYQARNGRWAAQIAKAGIRLGLGTHDTEEAAAAAYDAAASDIHGAFARLNLKVRINSGRLGYCGKAGRP